MDTNINTCDLNKLEQRTAGNYVFERIALGSEMSNLEQ